MRRRFAVVALVTAATLPAPRPGLCAQVSPAPATQPSTRQQPPSTQKPAAPPAAQPQTPAQPGKEAPKPAPETAKAATPEKPQEPGALIFASNAGMVFSPIKPDQETAYEEILGRVQEALSKSIDPVRKQQAASWKVYKATEPFQENTLYISVMDPAVKDANYNVFTILQEAYGDIAAREMFEKFRNAHAGGQNVANVTPLIIMSTGKVVTK